MAELILMDKQTGLEVGRQPMEPSGRYQFYTDCANHERILFESRYYTLHSVAWRVPEQDCVLSVTFHSHAVQLCED